MNEDGRADAGRTTDRTTAAGGRESVDLVVEADWVLTVDAADRVIDGGAVAVRDGRIVAVGPVAEIRRSHAGADRVELPGHLLMPGLVNAHTHLAMTIFRSFADDMDLDDFLGHVVPAELQLLDVATVDIGTAAAAMESVTGGVTAALDMYFFPDATLAAASSVGLRVLTGPVVLDGEGPDAQARATRMAWSRRWLEAHPVGPGWRPVLGPHSTYLVAPDLLAEVRDLAADHDALVHVHAAETAAEVVAGVERCGRRPVEQLDDLGLLGPRTVLGHGVHLTDDEIGRIAATGASVAHCPGSNLKLASGIAPVPALLGAGANVALGTDGAASSNDLDMFMAMRLAALVHKGVSGDPTVLSAHEVLKMATRNGAAALGIDAGSLEVGRLADLVALDVERPHLQPVFDPVSSVVYAAGRGDVRHVWIGGDRVVSDGVATRREAGPVTRELAALRDRVAATHPD